MAEVRHPEIRYVEYADPRVAAALGLLPFGVAGFYARRPVLGVTGLLFWPPSITWVVPMAPRSAAEFNYDEFKSKVNAIEDEVRRRPLGAPLGTGASQ
jgi:hypothetical protein